MKTLPNIKLTLDEYDFLLDNHKVDYGGEAIVCKSFHKKTAFKIFVFCGTDVPVPMTDNKFKKIKLQYQSPLAHSVRPLSTISINGELVGYEMTYDKKDTPLLEVSPKNMIDYLKQAREILTYYHSKDIIYGDVKNDNILVNRKTKKVKFCDMDNICMGDLPIDIQGTELKNFCDRYGTLDTSVDEYMHNILTLGEVNYRKKKIPEIIKILEVENQTFPKMYNQAAQKVLRSMRNPKDFIGGYIIDHVDNK